MADLPVDRLEATPPFTNVGTDVFGPWTVRTRKTRSGPADSKRWAVIFSCLCNRAIHVEIIESMDTSAFIMALRRFIALRGPVSRLRSDQGTNFVGAKNELDASLAQMDQTRIDKYLTFQNCQWILNPPHASHFGGVWEGQIGTVRRILEAMFHQLGRHRRTHEVLVTLMAEACAIVNSSPITMQSADPNDPIALSPSMLLTLKPTPLHPPPGTFVKEDMYGRKRWRQVQYLADQFWVRWKKEYLQNLQPRQKWLHTKPNISEDDVVLLREKDDPRCNWPLGRVVKTYPSEDGRVRKADILICRDGTQRTYLRPISELVLIQKAAIST